MRAIKHAFLSLIRKPTKAVMIFVILFVVYALVFTGIIIQNSVKSSKEYVRKELGAMVEMKPDFIKAMGNRLTPNEQIKLRISTSLAMEIAKDPLVKQVYITQMAPVLNDELESAIDMGSSEEEGGASFNIATSSSVGGSTFILMGSNVDSPLEFTDGTYELSQGRLRNAEDQGKDTLIISEEFAAKNNLIVGDTVEMTSSVDQQTYMFEVIGLFKGSSFVAVDQMYTSLESANKLGPMQGDEDSASSIIFQLHDPLDIDTFLEKHKNQMPNEYIVLYADDSEYKSLTRPLDLISTITSILLVVVFIAGVIIMLAIITIFVRDRKFEIGLLLSSGEGKLKIISQFVMEILLVSLIAFGLAAGASRFSSDYVASWIVENQLTEENTESTGNMMSGVGMVVSLGGPGAEKEEVKITDVAREFNVSVDGDVIRNLLLISFGLVIFSAGAPLIIILGYKPRESLQD